MAVQIAEVQALGEKIFKVPLRVYDLSTGEYRTVTIYHSGSPMGDNAWGNQMLKAQALGKRPSYSREWSGTQRYMKERQPEQELKLVDTVAWTGTILDFNDGTLKEGITLNDDGSFREVRIVLTGKDGIFLPDESKYVKDLGDEYMGLVSHLHGLKDPKRELPDYAYLWIDPKANKDGRNPVVRGRWSILCREDWRVDVKADCDAAGRRFAAWLVDENKPDNAITPAEYAEYAKLERKLRESPVLIE